MSSGRGVLVLTLFLAGLTSSAQAQPTFARPGRYQPTADETRAIREKADALGKLLGALPASAMPRDLVDDVAVFLKAGRRALEFSEFFDRKDVAATLAVLDRGIERARQLGGKNPGPWATARGSVARGFTSKVDGSVQPYAVIVPEGLEFSREKRVRLDVVLHGRDQTISESRFIARHDGKPTPKGDDSQGKITLHVFGRGNNAYRWAGETDVFEAIDAVKRNYPIDDRRVVLRGFSMGGAGAWHLGLHYPSLWSSVEAGAGFNETKNYAKRKPSDLPPYVEKALHIYDAVDYSLNAFDVPTLGYGGEDDPQLQATNNVVDALKTLGFAMKTDGLVTKAEGMDFERVIGAKMGHKVDPASAKLMAEFHNSHAVRGANLDPKRVRFVTYTLKYNRAAWITVERLVEHHVRTEVDAEVVGGKVVVRKAENVAVLGVDRHVGETLEVGGKTFPLESAVKGLLPRVYFRQNAPGEWTQLSYEESRALEENTDRAKRPGLQGPIDDAFTGPFKVIRGTGTPWSPGVGRWSTDRMERFLGEWTNFLRGAPLVKNDTDLTDEDIEGYNLVLFGDPGSNRVIARVLKDLPVVWTRTELKLAGQTYPAADHAPVLIAPNPLNPNRYVVINSGHTFGADAFIGTNALLYPRLGDYAVFQTGGREGVVRASGYFDEGWSLPRPGR
ncbi:MAG: alpha/beta hydrolase-fold protein [Isosphaeraceae bacterium]